VELVGRTQERGVIADLLFGETADVRTLLLRGDSGVGKSALLQDTVEIARAHGALIFRSVGVETESSIDFSALHQLVQPLMRAALDCPPEWLSTLQQLFVSHADNPVSAFELSNALIGVLDIVADRSTVLLLVDDIQWIDEASARMLAFVARRIVNPAVTVLVALRSGFESPLERAGLPDLLLLPLDDTDAADMLDQTAGSLDATTRRQLLLESGGNPLALLELPKTLTTGQRQGDARSSEKWTLTERLETVFAARLGELSDNPRWLLLLCALDRTEKVATIKMAAGDSWWFPDLVMANDIGLVKIDGDQVTFRHPLARSAVAQASSGAERQRAHASLADALKNEPDMWAWHRASASDDPDAEVADALASLARRALGNGDSRASLRAALRSVDLTPVGELHDLRAARSAFLANETGRTDIARTILPSMPPGHVFGPVDDVLPETDGYIAATRSFWLVAQDADLDAAAAILFTALRGTKNVKDRWVVELFDLLVLVCVRSGRIEHWTGLNSVLDSLGPAAPKSITLSRDALGDPARTAQRFAERLSAFRHEVDGMEPWQLMWMAACAVHVDDLPAWRGEIRRVIHEEEMGGSLASFMTALVLSSLDGLMSGNWTASREQAQRGLDTAERLNFTANIGDYLAVLAVIAARQGAYVNATEQLTRLQEWALPHGFAQHRAWALYAEAQIEMAQQRYDEAFGLLTGISPIGTLAPFQPMALMAFTDTVTAAWKSGRHDQARLHLQAARDLRLDDISARTRFHLAACEAIVATDAEKKGRFETALSYEGITQWPFDEARVRLHFGSWLRSVGDSTAARPQLQAAAKSFDRLGAEPWRQRAIEELVMATGGTNEEHHPTGLFALLTPQETRIAVLASEGRSNKEIAEALFLSPRTVASHLYKIFPKVGVTSRAGLHSKLNPDTHL
jgi:DNA-binding CsgD family transcriptional regulator